MCDVACNSRYVTPPQTSSHKPFGAYTSHTRVVQGRKSTREKKYLFQPFRAVVAAIEGRHVGEQGLGCADVGGGFVTTNVLFSGLHGHAKSGFATTEKG